jgi:hypothetical protein
LDLWVDAGTQLVDASVELPQHGAELVLHFLLREARPEPLEGQQPKRGILGDQRFHSGEPLLRALNELGALLLLQIQLGPKLLLSR